MNIIDEKLSKLKRGYFFYLDLKILGCLVIN